MISTGCVFRRTSLTSGATLHVDTSRKRKTNRVNHYWVADLGPDVTERALLTGVLTRGTRTYPDLRQISKRTEFLYGMTIDIDVVKVGERHVIRFRLEFVNDRYLPRGESILTEVVDLFREVVSAPHLENGTFPSAMVDLLE